MALYTTLSTTDQHTILKSFGLEAVVSVQSMPGGNANTSYRIHTEAADYVLTIFEEKTVDQVLQLATLLQHLRKYGFATSLICPTTSGKGISFYQEKPVLLKQWIAGDVVQFLNVNQLHAAGKRLAHLHQIPAPAFLSNEHAFGLETFSTVLGKAKDKAYENWLQKQTDFLTMALPQRLPSGLIHGDLFFDNILFDQDQPVGVIDFEEACCAEFVFDLGMSIVGLCTSEGEVDLAKVRALVSGYEDRRVLLPQEKAVLPLFIEYAATAISRWRYWKYHIDMPALGREDKHREMVDLVRQLKTIPAQAFYKRVFP